MRRNASPPTLPPSSQPELSGRDAPVRKVRDAILRGARVVAVEGPVGTGRLAIANAALATGDHRSVVIDADSPPEAIASAIAAMPRPPRARSGAKSRRVVVARVDGEAFAARDADSPLALAIDRASRAHPDLAWIAIATRAPRALRAERVRVEPLGPEALAKLVRENVERAIDAREETFIAGIMNRLGQRTALVALVARALAFTAARELESRIARDPARYLDEQAREGEPARVWATIRRGADWLNPIDRARLATSGALGSNVDTELLRALVGARGSDAERPIESTLEAWQRCGFAIPRAPNAEGVVRVWVCRLAQAAARSETTKALEDEATRALEQHAEALARKALEGQASATAHDASALVGLWLCGAQSRSIACATLSTLALHEHWMRSGGSDEHRALLETARERARAEAAAPSCIAELDLARAELGRIRGEIELARELLAAIPTNLESARLAVRQSALEASLARMRSDHPGATKMAEQSHLGAVRQGDRSAEVRALIELGAAHMASGRLAEGETELIRAVALARESSALATEAVALSHLGVAVHRQGRMIEALDLHERALELEISLGNLRRIAAEHLHLGYVRHQLGMLGESEREFDAAIGGLERTGDRHLLGVARAYAAMRAADAGDWADARSELARARTIADETEGLGLASTIHLFEAWIFAYESKWLDARNAAHAALSDRGRLDPMSTTMAHAIRALAIVHANTGESFDPSREEAFQASRRTENPAAAALARLCDPNAPVDAEALTASRASADVRRMLAVRGGEAREERPALSIAIDRPAKAATLGDGTRLELSKTLAPWRIFEALVDAHLAEPARGVTATALIDLGWPDERMLPTAAQKRLYTAIWTLRQAGLGALLEHVGGAYRLAIDIAIHERAGSSAHTGRPSEAAPEKEAPVARHRRKR